MDRNQIKNTLKSLSVLFVDDEEIVIDIMQDILPILFKNSYYARDGIEGIEQFKLNKPDVIITDISMPNMDGISMLKVIKDLDKDVKIILLSGHNEQDQIEACQEFNGEFIIKPISSNILYQALENVVNA